MRLEEAQMKFNRAEADDRDILQLKRGVASAFAGVAYLSFPLQAALLSPS